MPQDHFAKLVVADEAATRDLARRLAPHLVAGDVIALAGPLGSGKSVFARAVVHALGDPNAEVPSPTFTLVQTYDLADFTLWHFDLYRLETPREIIEIGFEEALADGVLLIEWPDRLGSMLPPTSLTIEFEFGAAPDHRTVRLSGPASWRERLSAALVGVAA